MPRPEVLQGAGGTGEGAKGEVDDLVHVAPAALDFQELLVPGGDVGGGQVRVGDAEQYLLPRFSSALILVASMRSSPPGVTRR